VWNPFNEAWGLVEGAAGWVGDRVSDITGVVDVAGGTNVGPVNVAGGYKSGSGGTYRITNQPANGNGGGFTTDSGTSYVPAPAAGASAPGTGRHIWLVPAVVGLVVWLAVR